MYVLADDDPILQAFQEGLAAGAAIGMKAAAELVARSCTHKRWWQRCYCQDIVQVLQNVELDVSGHMAAGPAEQQNIGLF
jgi:hypothetical protein